MTPLEVTSCTVHTGLQARTLAAILALAALPVCARAQIAFSDVSEAAGIRTSAGATGVSTVDFNRDGLDDITLGMQNARLALFVNNGDGTFTDVAESLGIESAGTQVQPIWVDINNDLVYELYVGTIGGQNRLYVREDNGTYVDRAAEMGLDTGAALGSSTFGDFDNDGFVDLFMAVDRDFDILYRNKGGTHFEDVSDDVQVRGDRNSVAMQATWFDVDVDGDQDLFAVHDGQSHPSRLHVNTTITPMFNEAFSRGISDVGAGNSMGIAWGDVNLDGYPDAYVSRIDSAGLYVNQGDATFKDEAGVRGAWPNGMSWGTVFEDFDNDGDEDLFVVSTTGFDGTKTLLYENRGGQFVDISESAGASLSSESMGLATGDFNNDGLMDLVFPSLTGVHRLLINETTGAGNWVRVRIVGGQGNGMSIGARIEVTSDGSTTSRWIQAGDSFCSQSTNVVHFGIGAATSVEQILIDWGPTERGASDFDINKTVTFDFSTSVDLESERSLPASFTIDSVFPNPVRGRAVLSVDMEVAGRLRAEVVDMLGRRTGTIVPERFLPAGRHELPLSVSGLAPGSYILRLETSAGGSAYPFSIVR